MFGETIAVIEASDDATEWCVQWLKEGFDEADMEAFMEHYLRVIEAATRAGVVPA